MPMYARGDRAKALCMRCGLLFLLPELVMDGYYPNLRVCTGCFDPPQPQEKLAIVSDAVALWRPSPDAVYVTPPVLTVEIDGNDVVLNWSGFNEAGANITGGYYVYRSTDQVNWTQIASLPNTADEWGAMVVETDTYTDSPGGGTWYYKVLGYDVWFNDPDG